MTDQEQKQLGKTLWAIADQLRGAMNADDFRDYMLAFLFLRYPPVVSVFDWFAALFTRIVSLAPAPIGVGDGGRPPRA